MLCAWIVECTVSFSCYILLDLFLIVLKFSSLSLWLWNSHWSGPPPDFRSDQHIHTYVVNYFSTYHDTCIQRHCIQKDSHCSRNFWFCHWTDIQYFLQHFIVHTISSINSTQDLRASPIGVPKSVAWHCWAPSYWSDEGAKRGSNFWYPLEMVKHVYLYWRYISCMPIWSYLIIFYLSGTIWALLMGCQLLELEGANYDKNERQNKNMIIYNVLAMFGTPKGCLYWRFSTVQ